MNHPVTDAMLDQATTIAEDATRHLGHLIRHILYDRQLLIGALGRALHAAVAADDGDAETFRAHLEHARAIYAHFTQPTPSNAASPLPLAGEGQGEGPGRSAVS